MDKIIELLNKIGVNTEEHYRKGDSFQDIDFVMHTIKEKINSQTNKKHYIGDIKWVLYQYICDMNSEWITIRCGNYAFEKISKLGEIDNFGCKKINGESFIPINVKTLDKKQLIISPKWLGEDKNISEVEVDTTIYPDDIVLYFA